MTRPELLKRQAFFERMKRMPTINQAATLQRHLALPSRRVQTTGTKETKLVMAKMREMPVRDASPDNGVCARTAAWCAQHVPVRGEEAVKHPRRPGPITRCLPRCPATRRSRPPAISAVRRPLAK